MVCFACGLDKHKNDCPALTKLRAKFYKDPKKTLINCYFSANCVETELKYLLELLDVGLETASKEEERT